MDRSLQKRNLWLIFAKRNRNRCKMRSLAFSAATLVVSNSEGYFGSNKISFFLSHNVTSILLSRLSVFYFSLVMSFLSFYILSYLRISALSSGRT